MPKFSIIVPVYNVEKYLDECVQSIVNQDFSDWELILVDDGSTDSSPALCDGYSAIDSRIITVHQKTAVRPPHATTELIAHMAVILCFSTATITITTPPRSLL